MPLITVAHTLEDILSSLTAMVGQRINQRGIGFVTFHKEAVSHIEFDHRLHIAMRVPDSSRAMPIEKFSRAYLEPAANCIANMIELKYDPARGPMCAKPCLPKGALSLVAGMPWLEMGFLPAYQPPRPASDEADFVFGFKCGQRKG